MLNFETYKNFVILSTTPDGIGGQALNHNFTYAADALETIGVSNGLYSGSSDISTVGTITSGMWNGTVISASYGGTGLTTGLSALNASNITSGTVATTRLGSGTANSSSFLRGDSTWSSITALGTITSGTWNGTVIVPTYGGTGLTTLTAHAVLLGEGTSNVAFATIGTAGKVLTDNGSGADPTFKTHAQKMAFTFDGGGSAISGTPYAWFVAQFDGTISGYYLIADQSGSVTMTVKKVAYGSYTSSSDFSSIVGAGTAPALSSAIKSTDFTLTSWTKTVTSGDIFQVQIASVSTITHCQIFFLVVGT